MAVVLGIEGWARLLTCGIRMKDIQTKEPRGEEEKGVSIIDMEITMIIVIANIYQVFTMRHLFKSFTCIN